MSDKKKIGEDGLSGIPLDAPLSQLLQVVTHDKYRIISLATRWAQEIKQRDQATTLQPQELLAQSLREILGKKVTLEEIEKLPPPPKPEKKDLDLALPTIILKDNGDTPKGGEPGDNNEE